LLDSFFAFYLKNVFRGVQNQTNSKEKLQTETAKNCIWFGCIQIIFYTVWFGSVSDFDFTNQTKPQYKKNTN